MSVASIDDVRRMGRWSAVIATALLAVIVAVLLGDAPDADADADSAAVPQAMSSESPHRCHGAPLQDVEHAVGSVPRATQLDSPDGVQPTVIVGGDCAGGVRETTVSVDGRAPPRPPAHRSAADLQVFRI